LPKENPKIIVKKQPTIKQPTIVDKTNVQVGDQNLISTTTEDINQPNPDNVGPANIDQNLTSPNTENINQLNPKNNNCSNLGGDYIILSPAYNPNDSNDKFNIMRGGTNPTGFYINKNSIYNQYNELAGKIDPQTRLISLNLTLDNKDALSDAFPLIHLGTISTDGTTITPDNNLPNRQLSTIQRFKPLIVPTINKYFVSDFISNIGPEYFDLIQDTGSRCSAISCQSKYININPNQFISYGQNDPSNNIIDNMFTDSVIELFLYCAFGTFDTNGAPTYSGYAPISSQDNNFIEKYNTNTNSIFVKERNKIENMLSASTDSNDAQNLQNSRRFGMLGKDITYWNVIQIPNGNTYEYISAESFPQDILNTYWKVLNESTINPSLSDNNTGLNKDIITLLPTYAPNSNNTKFSIVSGGTNPTGFYIQGNNIYDKNNGLAGVVNSQNLQINLNLTIDNEDALGTAFPLIHLGTISTDGTQILLDSNLPTRQADTLKRLNSLTTTTIDKYFTPNFINAIGLRNFTVTQDLYLSQLHSQLAVDCQQKNISINTNKFITYGPNDPSDSLIEGIFTDGLVHEFLHCAFGTYDQNGTQTFAGYSPVSSQTNTFIGEYDSTTNPDFNKERNKIENILSIAPYVGNPQNRQNSERFAYLGEDIISWDLIQIPNGGSYEYISAESFPTEILNIYWIVLNKNNIENNTTS